MRYCFTDVGTSLTSAQLRVGLCSGTTNILGDATTDHFVGFRLTGNSATLTRGAGPPAYYTWDYTAVSVVVDGVSSDTGDIEPAIYYTSAATTNRTCLFCDIARSGTTFTMDYFRQYSTAVADVSQATYEAQLLNDDATIADHAFISSPGTRTADEATNGVFDHINISWDNGTGASMEISDLALVRLA